LITRNTVFVLGAGASQAYGFPSGPALVDRICDQLRSVQSDDVKRLIQSDLCTGERLMTFRRRLLESRLDSIDAFIQRRPEHADVGKTMIALELMKCESETGLYPKRENDWYRALFNQIVPKKPHEFQSNRLKVITFNFDRSFEHALFRTLETLFDASRLLPGEVQESTRLIRMLPVLHIHGQLGSLACIEGDSLCRDYTPTDDPYDAMARGRELKVMEEEIDKETLATAHGWLKSADVICFLGFGFHSSNLERLNVPETITGKEVWCTRFRMGDGPVARVGNHFLNPVQPHWCPREWDIVRFLEESTIIHG
jgi:hypothetical protein